MSPQRSTSAPPSAAACTAERESEYFDGLVADKGDFNPFADRGWETLARRFVRMIGPDRIKAMGRTPRLLDVGCGTGQSRRLYVEHVGLYVGLDLSTEALRIARRQFPGSGNTFWVRADACALPAADGSVDVVAFSSVLHHIPDYTAALREALRVLRPGGQAFAFDPNLLHPAMALFRHPRSPLYIADGVSPNERPLAPRALRRAFAAAGFTDLGQRCQSNIPYRAVAPRLINACLSVYNLGDWLMEYAGFGRLFGTFVVTAGRKPGAVAGSMTGRAPSEPASAARRGAEAVTISPPQPAALRAVGPSPAGPRYSVVVPVYNEGANIGTYCRKARVLLPPGYELLICYDFDADDTLPALAALPTADKPPVVRLVRNDLGRGVRYAIEAGMRAAAAHVVVVMMADVSDDFPKVAEMVARAEAGADVVCASRYMRGGRQIGGPWIKGLMSRTAGVSLHRLAGLPTHDPTNSFKAYRRDFLRRTPIESTAGFCLGLELTVKAHYGGGRVEEVPAVWYDRAAGRSRFRLLAWLPHYVKWYSFAFMSRLRRGARGPRR